MVEYTGKTIDDLKIVHDEQKILLENILDKANTIKNRLVDIKQLLEDIKILLTPE